MNKDIQVATSKKGDISVISIKGDVTATTGGVIGNAYQDDTVLNASKILLHFDKNCYINSGGLASLIDIASEGRKKEQMIRACGLSEHFEKVFTLIGLTRCIPVFSSEEAALENF